MKLIKLMLAGMVVMSFALAQDNTQVGQATGPPPCDPNATYLVADPGPDGGCANYNDCNRNGVYDAGEPCGDVGGQGPPTCDVCGYTFTGEGDHHGHCDHEGCAFVFTSDNDHHGHCDHEGCAFVFTSDNDHHGHCDHEGCAFVFTSDNDHHGHCRVCDAEMNTDEDLRGHCDANPDHCRPQAGDTCGYGHDGDEACDYVFTGDEGEDHHHCDHCGLAVNSGEEMHNHLEADHPNRPARDNCEALDRGLGSFINENGDAIAVWATNGDGSPACGHDDGNN